MTHAFELLLKTVTGKVPPRTVVFAILNKLNCWLKTGNRKYEWDRLYLENADPFDYQCSAYERRKYDKTLDLILKFRRGAENVLELGCSIGVFTQILADHFGCVTALDISREALNAATKRNREKANVRCLRDDIRFMELGESYDVIICAEVLYYIAEPDAQNTFQRLKNHLNADGIIVVVGGVTIGDPTYFYFDGWEDVFLRDFKLLWKEICEDTRPYRIMIFAPRDSSQSC